MTRAAQIINVVDDDASLRTAVERLLSFAGYEVHTYASAGDFLLEPRNLSACLILDIEMPGPNGLELQEALAKRGEAPAIIFLTAYGDIPTTVRAMKAGAVDFLTKPLDSEALLNAVQRAVAQTERTQAARSQQKALRDRFEGLSPRQRTVFSMVASGRLNKQIATELGTTERTVKAHRARVMEKLDVHTVAELVRAAAQLQIS